MYDNMFHILIWYKSSKSNHITADNCNRLLHFQCTKYASIDIFFTCLAYWDSMVHECICITRPSLDQIVLCSTPSYYHTKCWLIFDWITGNEFHWHYNAKQANSIQQNWLEHSICKRVLILSRTPCVKSVSKLPQHQRPKTFKYVLLKFAYPVQNVRYWQLCFCQNVCDIPVWNKANLRDLKAATSL